MKSAETGEEASVESANVRLGFAYGCRHLDRFKLRGNTQFFGEMFNYGSEFTRGTQRHF